MKNLFRLLLVLAMIIPAVSFASGGGGGASAGSSNSGSSENLFDGDDVSFDEEVEDEAAQEKPIDMDESEDSSQNDDEIED